MLRAWLRECRASVHDWLNEWDLPVMIGLSALAVFGIGVMVGLS